MIFLLIIYSVLYMNSQLENFDCCCCLKTGHILKPYHCVSIIIIFVENTIEDMNKFRDISFPSQFFLVEKGIFFLVFLAVILVLALLQ